MGILDVEDGIVLRRLDHLGEVELERGVGALGQHHEAHDVLADFADDVGQRDEIARALGHLDRLAGAQQLDHLDDLDVEIDAAVGQRGDRRLDALDRPGMVGAPDVDQVVGAFGLLEMIGRVGAEIGPAAVRFLERPILVVAELGRAEQGQLDRLPIFRRLALRAPRARLR